MSFKHKAVIHCNYNDQRSFQCREWCNEYIDPKDDWMWQWHDAGQYGWYVFYFTNEADLLLFKLVHSV